MHPLRAGIVRQMLETEAESPADLAEVLGARLSNTSYHVRVLRALGVVDLASTTEVRGALMHNYRLRDPGAASRALGLTEVSATARGHGRRYPAAWVMWERAMAELGRRRQARAMSKAELARRVGITPGMVRRIELGLADPVASVVIAITTELDVSLRDVFAAADAAVQAGTQA